MIFVYLRSLPHLILNLNLQIFRQNALFQIGKKKKLVSLESNHHTFYQSRHGYSNLLESYDF